ncbi:hypothetical protein [Solicola sp. PLA-1-18]|uniref:hypothetical protein n=1 Tax=Solicola sp. PLA-1-18 TaxID=3380532 RepID=UPI003B80E623
MAGRQVLGQLAKAGPVVAKQLPKLWPLLLESKNRERLVALAGDLADASPTKRLRARLELTAALAEDVAGDASDDAERERAMGWAVRARNLDRKMNMPIAGRRAKADHRRSIRHQLAALHQEINEHLDRQATPPDR